MLPRPFVFLASIALALPAIAEEDATDLVRAELIANAAAVQPGSSVTLGVRFTVRADWHIYWMNPGDAGIATSVEFTTPEGYEVGELRWPLPIRFEAEGVVGYGYERELLLTTEVRVPASAKPGEKFTVEADTKWLACKVACVPGEEALTLELPIEPDARPANGEVFTAWRDRVPVAAEAPGSPITRIDGKVGAAKVIWRSSVEDLEAFPAGGPAYALGDLQVSHAVTTTHLRFTPEIFQKDAVPDGGGRILVTYRDEQGERHGVWVPVKLTD